MHFLISDLRVPFCAPYMYDYCLWKYDMHLLLIHSVLLLHALVQLQSTSKTGRILGENRPVVSTEKLRANAKWNNQKSSHHLTTAASRFSFLPSVFIILNSLSPDLVSFTNPSPDNSLD